MLGKILLIANVLWLSVHLHGLLRHHWHPNLINYIINILAHHFLAIVFFLTIIFLIIVLVVAILAHKEWKFRCYSQLLRSMSVRAFVSILAWAVVVKEFAEYCLEHRSSFLLSLCRDNHRAFNRTSRRLAGVKFGEVRLIQRKAWLSIVICCLLIIFSPVLFSLRSSTSTSCYSPHPTTSLIIVSLCRIHIGADIIFVLCHVLRLLRAPLTSLMLLSSLCLVKLRILVFGVN